MQLFLFGILSMAFFMVISKRIKALIAGFALQSFFLFLLVVSSAHGEGNIELFVVAFLILALKAVLIPAFLYRVAEKIQVSENLGLVVNPLLSLSITLVLTYLAYLFARHVMYLQGVPLITAFAISLSVMLIGIFLMIFRLKAIAQIIGLLVMENGSFLAAAALCGNMPFLLEITVFFDVLMCVIIFGIFVFKINQLFTHIDVNKLKVLKG